MAGKKKMTIGQVVQGTLESVSPLTAGSGITYIQIGFAHSEYGFIEGLSAGVDNFWETLPTLVGLKGTNVSFEYQGESEPNASGKVYPRYKVRF